ncbi:MAG TPA: nucleoside triphosphate pyrophosphohydrolase, partial [Rectinemataceae bacterium]
SRRAAEDFARLYAIVARLRAPDGCPWDRDQSPSSIRNNIIEEAYELVEAITEKDTEHVREEAGDLFMLATMTAYMYEEESAFSVGDALRGVAEKLYRRHPHVFGEQEAGSPEAVVELWNRIKETKEGRRKKDSILDEVPRHLPPLEKAYKLQKKVAKAGFDWKRREDVWAKVEEEFREARQALMRGDSSEVEAEIGDLIFSVVNLARVYGVDPGLALGGCNEKFSRRFRHVERGMREKSLPLAAEHMATMDELWNEAKLREEG